MKDWLAPDVFYPHSQRSTAKILVQLDASQEDLPITDLINHVEGAENACAECCDAKMNRNLLA